MGKYSVYMVLLLTVLTMCAWVADTLYPLPDLHQRDDYARLITAEDGTPLRAFAGQGGVWRYPLSPEQVSPLYIQALLGYEDRYFYHHLGVNPLAILRGCLQNIRAGRIISGGSTLTMQVARLIDPHGWGYRAKVVQILRALQLEYHFSKEEILTLYLNYAPFGGTVEGVGAASLTYLGKPPLELSHAEAALLAVLPQRPSSWRPDRYPQRAEKARNKVLDRLATNQVWQRTTVEAAKEEKVAAVHYEHPMSAPLLANRLRSKALVDQPLVTTIDAQLQLNLADCVAGYVENMDDAVSAAVMVVENETLAVRAYVGSADFFSLPRQGQVDMIRAVRSPGSTLKPFLYGMALDKGVLHSASLLSDAPQYYSDYRPNNFSAGFSGPVTMGQALQRSLNLPAIQVIEHLGPGVFAAGLRAGGLHLKIPKGGAPNPAIVLGGAGVRLEQLTGAYTALARQGRTGKLRYLASELGEPIREKYMLSQGAAWIIRSILADNPRPDRYRTSAVAGRNLAWKTGTSYGFRDAWAMGVTPGYTIGVWVGRPDSTPSPGTSGAQTAAPLLFTISDYLARPGEFFSNSPDTVSSRIICWPLGTTKGDLPHPGLCHEEYLAHILDNNVPPTLPSADQRERYSAGLHTIRVDSESGLLVPESCRREQTQSLQVALWPKELQPWQRHKKYAGLPPLSPDCYSESLPIMDPITITSLSNGSVLSFGSKNPNPSVTLSTVGGYGSRYWFVNGTPFAHHDSTPNPHYTFPSPGTYQFTVLDASGHSDSVTLTVKM